MVNTGETVLKDDGVFESCSKRQKLCGYACCKFSAGNWIMLLPGEFQQSERLGLKRTHLTTEGNTKAICHEPCQKGDLKPLDCSWYPLYPANADATKFLVADHRKCPIPNHELIDKMQAVHASAVAWEQLYPGSIEQAVAITRDFVGYMPFPYKLEYGSAVEMTVHEMQEIALIKELPNDYVCKEWTEIKWGYNAISTPEDENKL